MPGPGHLLQRLRGEAEVATPVSPVRSRLQPLVLEVVLVLEAAEGDEDCGRGDFPAGAFFDFEDDFDGVGLGSFAEGCEGGGATARYILAVSVSPAVV